MRVLLGCAAKSEFLGDRLWDRLKRAAAAGAAVLLVAAAVAIGMMWGGGGGEGGDKAAGVASAAADRSAISDVPTEVDAAQDTEAIELAARQALRPGLTSEERAEAVRQANLLRSQTPARGRPLSDGCA